MPNHSLTTLSYNQKAKTEIYNQLTKLIGNQIKVNSLCLNDIPAHELIYDDLILLTAPVVKNLYLPYLDPTAKYLIAKRTINPKKLECLFNIPPGSEVLVVNNLFQNTIEVINELETVGINHLVFHPYNPVEITNKTFKYAITPGEPHLVPPDIPNVIDLGTRLISIMTIAEILIHFTGSTSCDELVYSRYICDLVSSSMKLSHQVKTNKALQLQMEMAISELEDGVIMTDFNHIVTFYNTAAANIIGKADLKGTNILDLYPQPLTNMKNPFIQFNNRTIHVTNKDIYISENNKVHMLILKDLTQIRNIDEQHRKQLRYSGNKAKYSFSDIIFQSRTMSNIIEKAKNLAQTDSTILITGESGTGKELFAQSIHQASKRRKKPFVAINCAALSESLLESELFGYEDGAFTGAKKGGKIGLFELAHTGTIFLDEIGDAPLTIQTKLLRVLQEKEIMRISGNSTIPIDVRVIAATNKSLNALVENNKFRKDLYYRLNVLPLHLPSLRERKEDIELLLHYFLGKYAKIQNKPYPQISTDVKKILLAYAWPGNIRQLENIAEYIITVETVSQNLKTDLVDILSHYSLNTGFNSEQKPVDQGQLLDPDLVAKKDIMAILKIFRESYNKEHLIGRSYLLKKLHHYDITLSEQQIKTRLSILKKYKLINSFVGKGSKLTQKGKQLVDSWDK